MTLLWNPKYQRNYGYNKVFEAFINVVETYGKNIDELVLVLCQSMKNGFVAGADGDVLGEANTAQISADKETVSESTEVDILMDAVNI